MKSGSIDRVQITIAPLNPLPPRQQFPQRPWHQPQHPLLYPRLVFLPLDAQSDHGQSNEGEHEGEQQAVFEQVMGEVAEIQGDADAAADGEDAAREGGADADHAEVDAEIDEFVQFAVAAHHRQAAPEREYTEQVQPEGVVVARTPAAQVDPQGDQGDDQSKPQRHPFAHFPVQHPIQTAEQKRREVHAHVPERDGDGHEQERDAIALEQHGTGGQRGEFHDDPVPFHIDVIVAVGRGVGPDAERDLQGIHRQWCERDGEGGEYAGGDAQVFPQQHFGQAQAEQGVGDADAEQTPAAVTFPAEVHEQGHGADGDQTAEVIEDVGGPEAGLILRAFAQEGPQTIGLCRRDDAGHGRGLQILGFEFHGVPPPPGLVVFGWLRGV